ncbi:MAG: restriction endonuclease subunit S, partial [Actinobacteria bacterium]|nr:restriction endonuclease subunit S [Actinomycetota bacterium]
TKGGVVVRNLDEGGKFPENFDSYQQVSAGDLVTCLFDVPETPRTIGLSPHNGMITGAYDVFEFTERVNPRYFEYYYLALDDRKGLSYFYSGLRNVIRTPVFLSIPMPVPPLDEQKAIADFLDRELAQIDALIEKLNQVAVYLDERERSLIWSMVTKGLENNSDVKSAGLSWIAQIPSHWEVRKIAGVHKFVTGGTPNSTNEEFYDGTYPWITISDLNGDEVRETKSSLSHAGVKAANLQMVPKGALLFSFKLSVGQVAFTGLDCYTNEAIAAFIPNELIFQRWAFYAYPVFLMQNANWNIYGARLMNAALIRGARILLPPIAEQVAIAGILDAKVSELQALRKQCHASAELMRERRRSLISAAVTGKIDVRKVA